MIQSLENPTQLSGTVFRYDGSFPGFLTAAGLALKEKSGISEIKPAGTEIQELFMRERSVETDTDQAQEVWNALAGSGPGLQRLVYFAFLSGKHGIENLLVSYLQLKHTEGAATADDEENATALLRRIAGLARRVGDEKIRMEAAMRFASGSRDVPVCEISPEYDVLPLLTRHCRLQFGGQPWMLYDCNRGYGIYSRNGSMSFFRKGRPTGPASITTAEAFEKPSWPAVRKAV